MAVEAKVPIIVTRNVRHSKPAEEFGIEVMCTGQVSGQAKKEQMTTIQAQVPDPSAKQLEELAQQEKVTLDAVGDRNSSEPKPRHCYLQKQISGSSTQHGYRKTLR